MSSLIVQRLADLATPSFPLLLYGALLYIAYRTIGAIVGWRKWIKMVDGIPGPRCTNSVLGNLHLFKSESGDQLVTFFNTLNGLVKLYENSNSFFRLWIGPTPMVVFHKAESAEKIFSSTIQIQKAIQYNFLMPWLGTGLLTSSGAKWSQRRKMLTPAFHFNILETFLSTMNEQSHVLVDKIREQVRRSPKDGGAVLDVVPCITYATLDIICETAMGVKIDSQNNPNSEYVLALHRVGCKTIKRILAPWLWNDFVYHNLTAAGREDKRDLETLHRFTMKVIKERKTEALQQAATTAAAGKQNNKQNNDENNNNNNNEINRNDTNNNANNIDYFSSKRKRLAFLDLLIEQHLNDSGSMIGETDIREEVDTFMFEGHDTTAMSLIWTLFLLGHHPNAQERVHREIDEILRQDGIEESETNVHFTGKQLRDMKYLEACIKESLRLFPSVPFIGRIAATDIEIDNCLIPKGSSLGLLIYAMHRDETVFPRAAAFVPERFVAGSDSFVRNPYAYVPFSAGPRNCIGQKFAFQEEKILLASVLRHFRLQSIEHLDAIKISPELVIRPKQPIDIRFIARHPIVS